MPSIAQQKRLRDLGWSPSTGMFRSLVASVVHCPIARALSRGERITLEVVSKPALAKRPSVAEWIGRDLAPIACGVLQEILDDAPLQRGISSGEIACLLTTTRSVLKTEEHASVGLFQTTITYFFHEGTLYSDAIGIPAPDGAVEGYEVVPMDHIVMP